MIPALVRGGRGARRGLDDYAGAVEYAGLTLVALNWAADHRHRAGPAVLASDAAGSSMVRFGWGALALVRSGATWFAVKSAVGPPTCARNRARRCRPARRRYDLRDDFGLLGLKRPTARGRFADVIPQRPRAAGVAASAGPLLLGRRGPALPIGYRTRVARDGAVTVRGAFVPTDGRGRRRAAFAFRPAGTGVDLAFRARARDRYELSFFFTRRPRWGRVGATFMAGDRRYGVAIGPVAAAAARLRGGYASATEPRLWRLRVRVRVPALGPLTVAYRPG